jgi:hypothetical protein
VVPVPPQRSNADVTSRISDSHNIVYSVSRTSRARSWSYLVCALHNQPDSADRTPWPQSKPLCRRHAGLRAHRSLSRMSDHALRVSVRFDDITSWMKSNRLHLSGTSRNSCSVLTVVGCINFQLCRSGSESSPSGRLCQSVISASTSTQVCRRRLTFSER